MLRAASKICDMQYVRIRNISLRHTREFCEKCFNELLRIRHEMKRKENVCIYKCGGVSLSHIDTTYILYVHYLGNILRSETCITILNPARFATLQSSLI